MFETQRVEIEWAGRKLSLETGRLARQSDAAVLAQYGETSVLATVVAEKEARPGWTTSRPPPLSILPSAGKVSDVAQRRTQAAGR